MTARSAVPVALPLSISESVSVSGPGRWVHVSGQIPSAAAGAILDGAPEEQVSAAFDNLERALGRAGAALADVVKTTLFLTDLAWLPIVERVRATRVGDPPPASSAVQVAALYGGARIEVEAVAFVAAG